jgi:4-amino-4-deoxy-L-arabinose transferase-like glycosyltransferase
MRTWKEWLLVRPIPISTLRWFPLAGFLIALLVRVVISVVLMPPDFLFSVESDAGQYISEAYRFLEPDVHGSPGMYLPMGYPAFMALAYRLLGPHITSVRIFQALFDAGTCVLVFLIARQLYAKNPRIAVLSMLVAIFYPPFVVFVGFQLTEALYLFLTAALVLSAIHWLRGPTWLNSVVTGGLLGACNLVREELLLFPAVLVILLYLQHRSLRKTGIALGLVLLGMLLIIAPWIARNSMMVGQPVFLTDRTTYMLSKVGLLTPPPSGYDFGDSSLDPRASVSYLWSMRFARINEMLDFRAAIRSPIHYVTMIAVRTMYVWLRPVGAPALPTVILVVYYIFHEIMLILAIVESISIVRQRDYPTWVLIGLWAYKYLLHMFTTTSLVRYSMPVLPFIIIMASAALKKGVTALAGKRVGAGE